MPEPVRWSVHPARTERPWRTALLLAVIAAVAVIFARTFASPGIGVLAAGLLVGAVSRYILPSRYEVSDVGARVSHLGSSRTVAWREVARVDPHDDGFFLSPYETPHRLDTFRGTFLRLPTDPHTRRAIEAAVAARPVPTSEADVAPRCESGAIDLS